ncbi:MAG: orotidine-5'-phosphate decarboxylase [Candidatus Liptonbacteria bacterium]|nr:orotidine-5'-phosphate decarboxylase [Candidatus Liptonbacteria bacterium]
MNAKDRIIVALDVDNLDRAKSLVEMLTDYVGGFKLGLGLIYLILASIVAPKDDEEAQANFRKIRELFSVLDIKKAFLDGKFDDIPNTVGAAARVVARMGVKMFNVHASAGIDAMGAAALAAVAESKGKSLVLAVTVLTSREENEGNLTFGGPTKARVLQFAREAKLAALDGTVSSPQELGLLGKRRELAGQVRVTPGIRSSDAPADDQKRTMSAGEAIKAGADYLVIGRPITAAADPVAAAKKIAEEIAAALEE